jgi:hypothetical protein
LREEVKEPPYAVRRKDRGWRPPRARSSGCPKRPPPSCTQDKRGTIPCKQQALT